MIKQLTTFELKCDKCGTMRRMTATHFELPPGWKIDQRKTRGAIYEFHFCQKCARDEK